MAPKRTITRTGAGKRYIYRPAKRTLANFLAGILAGRGPHRTYRLIKSIAELGANDGLLIDLEAELSVWRILEGNTGLLYDVNSSLQLGHNLTGNAGNDVATLALAEVVKRPAGNTGYDVAGVGTMQVSRTVQGVGDVSFFAVSGIQLIRGGMIGQAGQAPAVEGVVLIERILGAEQGSLLGGEGVLVSPRELDGASGLEIGVAGYAVSGLLVSGIAGIDLGGSGSVAKSIYLAGVSGWDLGTGGLVQVGSEILASGGVEFGFGGILPNADALAATCGLAPGLDTEGVSIGRKVPAAASGSDLGCASAGLLVARGMGASTSGIAEGLGGALEVVTPPPVANLITVKDIGWQWATLEWTNEYNWEQPWIIQRKTGGAWSAPDFESPMGWENYKWLGANQWRYTDLDQVDQNTLYYYRVMPVTNIRDVVVHGASPVYGDVYENSLTTGAIATNIYDVTDSPYNAVGNGVADDYPAIKAAVDQAQADQVAAGGAANLRAVIAFPAGTYKMVLPTGDVQIQGGGAGQLFVQSGDSYQANFFGGKLENIEFLGEVDGGGDPTTFLVPRLWHDRAPTEWLEILNPGRTDPGDHSTSYVANCIRFYFIQQGTGSQNVSLVDLDIDGGAVPVNTGKEWYSLDEKRYQWDISHKLLTNWTACRNMKAVNVRTRNWRGEVFYVGGSNTEKYLIRDCVIERSNSSSISMSADLEAFNNVIRDSANAAIESAIFDGQTSTFTGQSFYQSHIVFQNTVYGLDQSGSGMMKNLPGVKTFSGLHIFDDVGAVSCVVANHVYDCKRGYAPWVGCTGNFLFQNHFYHPPRNQIYGCTTLDLWPHDLYDIEAAFYENLWLDNHAHFTASLDQGYEFLYTQSAGQEEDWIIEKFHFHNDSGGTVALQRLWTDTSGTPSARERILFKDWTKDANLAVTSVDNYLVNTGGAANKGWPAFDNTPIFIRHERNLGVVSGNNMSLVLGYVDMTLNRYNAPAGTTFTITQVPNIDRYPEGIVMTFKLSGYNAGRGDTVIMPASAAWNNFPSNISFTNASQVLTAITNAGELDFISFG